MIHLTYNFYLKTTPTYVIVTSFHKPFYLTTKIYAII